MTPSPGSLRATLRRVFRLENRRRSIRPGRLEHIRAFPSAVFGNERDLTVYLPAGYDEDDNVRYPVLYMQDGQNLFEPERAFIPGQHWRLAEAADESIASRTALPMIIIGIDHAGPARIDEYTPTRDPKKNAGGHANDYGRFLLQEVKPAVDARFRTDPADTSIGGSSLGGLVSLHLGLTHPDVFRAIAALSPSVWWDSGQIVKTAGTFPGPRRPRIWLDTGGREGRDALHDVRRLRDQLLAKGWSDHLHYFEDRRADHSERAWAKRAKAMLEFLFPASPAQDA